MNVAIIGCGLIGEKRARALSGHRLVATADTDLERAKKVARLGGCSISYEDWKAAAAHPEADIIIVATTNNWLTPVGRYALEHGKHVLIEKPGARSAEELKPFLELARKAGPKVKVGFNLRFHPAMLKAREIIDSGVMGELMFIRGRYGHGGRAGYNKEWRADKAISGGGELLDQGVHLIDLARWYLGDFERVTGWAPTCYWDMPVDDNGFMALRTARAQMAWLHASCTEWKNMFCLEIYGLTGKLQIDGLGGSYGEERLTFYRMLPEMGPPETTAWNYPGADKSWEVEFSAFIDAIKTGKPLCGDLEDAYKALSVVGEIYRSDLK
ncbi:MAG: LmbZ [Elusimicrobia bacterium GWC2_51_8]|nr:MAG: LmbZ [Elusimicrobia bacterium GWA2_51_34]OGR65255.1 MAG: LmbZ [Elusimicrobia bacterium GWC2_51_8]OGR88348.1 MAG: LmbZ [Elusimicrobia bacterium GWF2_52_66]HAF94623.1 LmbZ [Elusimicrobiota bacterium]HCE98043.1 LmbZ [Elusimicrobiota bacterium]